MRKKGRGDIVKVGDLFEVYTKRLKAPQGTVITTFREVVKDLLDVSIDKKQCAYTVATKTFKITAPGPLKSEILIRKREILMHMKGRLGEKSAPTEII